MTTFKSAIYLCGLSQSGAADYLGVSLASIKDWCRGKGAPPIGVWIMMADLWGRIEDAGESAAEIIDPESMDRQQLNGVQTDEGSDPLPEGSDTAAGALAIMSAILNRNL